MNHNELMGKQYIFERRGVEQARQTMNGTKICFCVSLFF